MQELAADLKAQRRRSGLSIQDLFEKTRINPEVFQAIESGRFDVLPEVYTRLFLRTYAREIGLDPKEVLRRFEALNLSARERPTNGRHGAREEHGPRTGLFVAGALAAVLVAFVVTKAVVNRDTAPPSSILSEARVWVPTTPSAPRETPPSGTAAGDAVGEAGGTVGSTSVAAPDQEGPTPEGEVAGSPPSGDGAETVRPSAADTGGPGEEERESPREEAGPTESLPDGEADADLRTTELESLPPVEEVSPQERILSAYAFSPSFSIDTEDTVLTLSSRAVRAAHVVVAADGERVFQGTLASGARDDWTARTRFLVELEEPSAVSLFLQGHDLDPPVQNGRKLRLFISRSGIWVEEVAAPVPAAPTEGF